jgi:uncharacterized membrane protein
MQASAFFTPDDRIRIEQAIREAELNTSGEIRVHVETSFTGELLDRAATVFARLGMHKTALRNGVLFYMAIQKRQFAVIGDAGINQVVPGNFWDEIKSMLEVHFRNSQFAEGLAQGIVMAGEQLKKHFPYRINDLDELPNQISTEENTKS